MSQRVTKLADILSFLRDNNRSKAAENILLLHNVGEFRVADSRSVAAAIDTGMSWGKTPQGHEYWSRTKRLVKLAEKLAQ